MSRIALRTFAALLALLPLAAVAQSSPLAGTWAITYAAGMSVENDVPTPIMATARLTITVAGDSLVATLLTEPPAGMPPRPESRFAARRPVGAEVTFLQRSQVRLNVDGEESAADALSTWVLKADGDVLTGTFERRVEGIEMPGLGATPVTGKRL